MAVERDITWNIRHFQGALRCDRNFDVVYRVFRICGREACMFFVDGFAKDEIMEKLLEFFYGIQDEDLLRDAHTFSKSCVPYCEVAISGEEDTIVGQILSGPPRSRTRTSPFGGAGTALWRLWSSTRR